MATACFKREKCNSTELTVLTVLAHISKSLPPTYGCFPRTRSQMATRTRLSLRLSYRGSKVITCNNCTRVEVSLEMKLPKQ